MLQRFCFIFLLVACSLQPAAAQDTEVTSLEQADPIGNFVQAYRDYRGYLYAFRNGMPTQLESQEIKTLKSKGTVLGYVNNANNLIAYYNGTKNDLSDATNTTFDLTDHLLIYLRDQTLGVFEDGNTTRLTYFIRDYLAADRLVAFRDKNMDLLKVYYQGKISDVEYTGIGTLGGYAVGKNTIGFVSSNGYFKIWHDGTQYEIDNTPPVVFKCGKDVVAWINGTTDAFEVFYNGKVLKLSEIRPKSFQVGDGIVAFVTDDGSFKLFSGGKLMKAESYEPEMYAVKDSAVLFFADTKLQLLLNGTRYQLDQSKPSSYQLSNNRVVWEDFSRRIWMFDQGRVQQVTTESHLTYQLNGDVLRYDLSDGTSHIFYHGKTF